MILVDTSVWADHFRTPDAILGMLLGEGRILMHAYVIGELALGNLKDWAQTVEALCSLPRAPLASEDAFLSLISKERLVATGIGFVDAHLLASAREIPGVRIWSRDKRLAAKADALGIVWTGVSA